MWTVTIACSGWNNVTYVVRICSIVYVFAQMLMKLSCMPLITCKVINLAVVTMHPHVDFIVQFYYA